MSEFFREVAQWCARCAVTLLAAYTSIIAISYQIGSGAAWPIALLQFFPHIYILPCALVIVVFSLTLARSWQFAATCSLALFLTYVMGFTLNIGNDGTRQVRLMTYNVKGYLAADKPAGMEFIAREIATHDADVVVLQDAREITAMLLETPEIARLVFGNRQLYTYGQYIVASRHSLHDCGPRSISFREKPHTYVRCVVSIGSREVDLFAVHFVTPRHGINALRNDRLRGIGEWKQNIADRMTQAELLATELRASPRPVIVAGDLNAPPNSLPLQTLMQSGVRDAFSVAGTGFGYTYGHSHGFGKSFIRLDHILVGSELGVVDCFVGEKHASTHRPVIADLFLRSP